MIFYQWFNWEECIYTLVPVRWQNWAKVLLYIEKHSLLDFYLFQTVSICCHYDFISSAELSPRSHGQDEACEEKNRNFHYDMDVDMSIHNGTGAIQFEMLNLVSYLF